MRRRTSRTRVALADSKNPYLRWIQEHPACKRGYCKFNPGKSAEESLWRFVDSGFKDEGEVLSSELKQLCDMTLCISLKLGWSRNLMETGVLAKISS